MAYRLIIYKIVSLGNNMVEAIEPLFAINLIPYCSYEVPTETDVFGASKTVNWRQLSLPQM